MSDIPEEEFHKYVGEFFADKYGPKNVEHEYYLEQTGRFADFKVEAPIATLFVEVENNFEASFTGIGQSVLYATHEPDSIPVVVLPEHHIESPEYKYLRWRGGVLFITIPYPDEYNV